ncbi:general secretion pathway protein GspD, partial [Flavobacteriaceae bacterium]|nr:general secretion pathway protein GspD [Flavobacteriaceae bacterium]
MKKLFITLCLLFFCLSSFSQQNNRLLTIESQLELQKIDTPGLNQALNINITQATLSNFLLAISNVHKLNISVAPELNNINVVNNFSNVEVKDVLLFLVKSHELDIDFTGNILSIKKFKQEPKKDNSYTVDYSPSTQLITLDIGNSPLDEVFRAIMDSSGKNLLFTPDIQKNRLTLYIKEVPLDVALNKLASTNDLSLSKSRDGFYMFD